MLQHCRPGEGRDPRFHRPGRWEVDPGLRRDDRI